MPRTRAADYAEKRAMILHHAAELFAREGYDRTSMAALARECSMSKALLYHYYDSKAALLFDVIEDHLERLCAAVIAADDAAAAPEPRLRRLVETLLEEYRYAEAQHRVQVDAISFLPEERRAALQAIERRLVVIFADALHAVNPALDNETGLLKPVSMSLFGMLNWHYRWFREDGPMSRADYARLATRMIVEGARALP